MSTFSLLVFYFPGDPTPKPLLIFIIYLEGFRMYIRSSTADAHLTWSSSDSIYSDIFVHVRLTSTLKYIRISRLSLLVSLDPIFVRSPCTHRSECWRLNDDEKKWVFFSTVHLLPSLLFIAGETGMTVRNMSKGRGTVNQRRWFLPSDSCFRAFFRNRKTKNQARSRLEYVAWPYNNPGERARVKDCGTAVSPAL